jgi:hypothetical protein
MKTRKSNIRWWLAGGAAALVGSGLFMTSLGTQAQEGPPPVDPIAAIRETAEYLARQLFTVSGGNEPGNRNAEQTFQALMNFPVANRPLTAADRELGLQTPGHNWRTPDGYGGWGAWSEVVMDKSTGAECMDGSNYKMYTKLNPATTNLMILMEPGGACFDHGTCTGAKPQVNPNGTPKISTYTSSTSWSYDPITGNDRYDVVTRATREIKLEAPLARNPNGIPSNYLDILKSGKTAVINSPLLQKSFILDLQANSAVRQLGMQNTVASLFESRRMKTEDWNIVFFPYCTADMHAGNAINTYLPESDDMVSTPVVVRHKGLKNVQAGLSILRDRLPQPAQVLFAGQSAGGAAVDLLRPFVSHVMAPTDKFYAFADGVPLGREVGKLAKPHTYTAPFATENDHRANPSTNLFNAVRVKHWKQAEQLVAGQYRPANPLTNVPDASPLALVKKIVDPRLAAIGVAPIDVTNLSDYGRKVSQAFPNDRMLYIMSQSDQLIPSYIYAFNPGRDAAAIRDGDINATFAKGHKSWLAEYHRDLWGTELNALKTRVSYGNHNVGYFMPSGRLSVMSHVLTGLNYEGSVNYDNGTTITQAIDNLLDRNHPPVMRQMENNNRAGLFKPLQPGQEKTALIHKLYMHFTNPALVASSDGLASSIFGQGTMTMVNRLASLPVVATRPVPMTPHDNGSFGLFDMAMGTGGGVDSQMPVSSASGNGLSSGPAVAVSAGLDSKVESLEPNPFGKVGRPRGGGVTVRAVKSP